MKWISTFGMFFSIGSLLLFSTSAMAHPWASTDIAMPVHKVGPHSYYVEGALQPASAANQAFMSNAGFVVTKQGVVVFDSLGSPALADRMVREIHKRTRQPIKLAVISHYHADHFYGIPALRAVGAKIWADKRAKAYLKSDVAQERLQQRRSIIGKYLGPDFKLPLPDRWIDGDHPIKLEYGDVTLKIMRLGPAHTPEDLGMLVEPDGVLYSGDVVYTGRIPYIGKAGTGKWLQAINRMLKMHYNVMVPGHGPASRQPKKDARLTRDYIKYLRKTMGKAADNLEDFHTAYAHTDWSRFKHVPAFDAANKRNAYNVYLQMQAQSFDSAP